MNQNFLGLCFVLLLVAGIATAQKPADSKSSITSTQSAAAATQIASGTQVSGQLQSTLDVKNAKVGDKVFLKTTKAVKQNGQVVVSKGSMLVGRVTDVAKKTKGNATSSVGVVFDRLQQGSQQIPINAVIISVLQANTAAQIDDMQSSTYSSASTQTSSRSSGNSGGGLLGGVTNTVGGVVDTTTHTVGDVASTAGRTVGNTTGTLAGSVKGLSISQSTSASASGGSTLSMSGDNLKLDKGTTFNLSISSSTTADVN